MSQMTTFIADVLELVAEFLWSEPIRYFVGLALMVVILRVIIMIFSISTNRL